MLNNNIATITVPDQDGATSLSSDLDLGSITIKRTGDNVSQTYSISATYASTPVTDIISSILGGDNNNISNIIAASFNGFDLTPSLSGTTIALSGATNTDITDATGTIANNISAASRLPAGYVVTDTSGNPYSFNDPDSAITTELSDYDLANLIIAEHDTSGTIISGNQASYFVSLSLAELLQLENSDFSFTPASGQPSASISVDNASLLITLTGLTNACTTSPCEIAETDFGALSLTETASVFTISDFIDFTDSSSGGITSASLAVPDVPGAACCHHLAGGHRHQAHRRWRHVHLLRLRCLSKPSH